jgi:hypothetical protein
MLKHEEPQHQEFAQLCALAMVGDASPDELLDLRGHLQECEDCRREYREFAQLVLPQLWAMENGGVGEEQAGRTRASAATSADTSELRASFLHRAQAQGITFSAATLAAEEPAQSLTPIQMPARNPVPRQPRVIEIRYAAAIAAILLLAVLFWRMPSRPPANQPVDGGTGQPHYLAGSQAKPSPSTPRDPAAIQLAAELAASRAHQDELQQSLTKLQAQLSAANADRAALSKQIAQKSSELAALQADDSASQQTLASLRGDLAALQARADLNAATYRDAQVKVQQLTAQVSQAYDALDRERAMQTATHEVGNLMAERNLHIIDVVDTDGAGKTKPTFGRIFFTENKHLLFYAYDLNEKRLESAKYTYRVWGETGAQRERPTALGVLTSDDKSQKRWAFQYDDPKVLSHIESVFVTLEATGKQGDSPKGQRLMYAYLRGEVNHP